MENWNELSVQNFSEFAGKGITGMINNQQFWLGKSEWHREQTEADHGLDHIIDKMQK